MLKDLKQRGEHLVDQARHRAHLLRGEGRERLFLAEAQTLERLDGWLEGAVELPVVGERVASPASKALHEARLRRTGPGIEGYDAMNAKTAARAVRELDQLGLLKVRRHEAAHKQRKTVLDAVDAQLERLFRLPEALAA